MFCPLGAIILPNLSHLRLDQFHFSFPSHKLRDAVHSLAPRLRTLHLKNMHIEEDDLALLLKHCSSPTLICHSISTELRDSLSVAYSPRTDSPMRKLDTLVWDPGFHTGDSFAVELMTRWTQGIPLSLRRLAIRRIFEVGASLSFVQCLLDASAGSLEHLFIHFDGWRHDPAHLLNLAGNIHLQTLHIVVPGYRVPSLTVVLSRLNSPDPPHALTSIVIRFIVYPNDDEKADPIDPAHWQRLCAQLGQLCAANPSLNCTLCFDLSVYAGASPISPQSSLGRSLTLQQVRRVCDWTTALPHPSRTEGRVRFAVVWMCIGEEAFFSGLEPPRCFPDQYYLGDPTWYYAVHAPFYPGL